MSDGDKLKSIILNKENNWEYTFTDLHKYREGKKEIQYTILEDDVEGYVSQVSGDMKNGFVITNTSIETIDIPVTKKWVGKEGESATIRLLANDIEINSKKLTNSDNWKHTFSNLQKYDQKTGEK